VHSTGIIYGYARVSTDGQSVAAQLTQLKAAGCGKVFQETASGARTDRVQLRKAIDRLETGDTQSLRRINLSLGLVPLSTGRRFWGLSCLSA
jgi:DNA invertase Pin-like site-specific DNA recombinase